MMELPRTLELALAGELEPWRVDAVVVASRDVAQGRLDELEARLYATDVARLPRPRLVERVRRAAVKADPESVTRGVNRAPRRRSLRVAPAETTGLMRWSLEVPDELSRRMFAAVDALAQEYLTADQHRRDSEALEERRTVEAARLDALGDLVLANAHVETVVELLVPVDAGTATFVKRPEPREAVVAELGKPRRRSLAPPHEDSTGRTTPTSTTTTTPAGELAPAAGATGSPPTQEARDAGGLAVDEVLVDLVLGSVTTATLAAGEV